MNSHVHRLGILFLLAIVAVHGCASPRPTAANYSVRRIEQRDRVEVLEAVVAALASLGYQIDRVDHAEGLVTTLPTTVRPDDRAARSHRGMSAARDLRRIAQVRVEQTDQTSSVYCRVVVQHSTTEVHRMFGQDQRGRDVPNDTAIDRDAATTREQNTVWESIRRDRVAERQLHAATLERLMATDSQRDNDR